MYTEEEARKKWCPFARLTHPQGDPRSWNRCMRSSGLSEDIPRCIASECMAWRWQRSHRVRETGVELDGLTDINVGQSDAQVVAIGYCGLAGDTP